MAAAPGPHAEGLRVRNIARDIERFLRSNKELEDDVIEDVTSDVNDLLRRNGISSGRGTGQTLSINSFRALCHKATGNVLMENMSHIEAFLKGKEGKTGARKAAKGPAAAKGDPRGSGAPSQLDDNIIMLMMMQQVNAATEPLIRLASECGATARKSLPEKRSYTEFLAESVKEEPLVQWIQRSPTELRLEATERGSVLREHFDMAMSVDLWHHSTHFDYHFSHPTVNTYLNCVLPAASTTHMHIVFVARTGAVSVGGRAVREHLVDLIQGSFTPNVLAGFNALLSNAARKNKLCTGGPMVALLHVPDKAVQGQGARGLRTLGKEALKRLALLVGLEARENDQGAFQLVERTAGDFASTYVITARKDRDEFSLRAVGDAGEPKALVVLQGGELGEGSGAVGIRVQVDDAGRAGPRLDLSGAKGDHEAEAQMTLVWLLLLALVDADMRDGADIDEERTLPEAMDRMMTSTTTISFTGLGEDCRVCGNSLGLSCLLALISALANVPLPATLFSLGSISPKGLVQMVAGLLAKLKLLPEGVDLDVLVAEQQVDRASALLETKYGRRPALEPNNRHRYVAVGSLWTVVQLVLNLGNNLPNVLPRAPTNAPLLDEDSPKFEAAAELRHGAEQRVAGTWSRTEHVSTDRGPCVTVDVLRVVLVRPMEAPQYTEVLLAGIPREGPTTLNVLGARKADSQNIERMQEQVLQRHRAQFPDGGIAFTAIIDADAAGSQVLAAVGAGMGMATMGVPISRKLVWMVDMSRSGDFVLLRDSQSAVDLRAVRRCVGQQAFTVVVPPNLRLRNENMLRVARLRSLGDVLRVCEYVVQAELHYSWIEPIRLFGRAQRPPLPEPVQLWE